MKILLQILVLSTILFSFALPFGAQTKPSSKILFVPIDDRPPTAQWVIKMGEIGDAEVVAPPHNLLGNFTDFGKSDEIIKWLGKQNLQNYDAAVISIDMLAYGGLVAMREFQTDEKTALKRLDFIREIKRRAPKLKIYVSSVIMRLAPTGNVVNEAYRANLAEWAEISVDLNMKARTNELEKQIPAKALEDYKSARKRDLKINLAAIKLVEDNIVEQLILGQDDAKPKGVHVADRERLISEVRNLNLQSKIGVQPGADELSMLQLSRSLSDKFNYRPKIKAIYSSEKIRNQVMPYEDRPLHQTVSFQIESVGAKEVENESEADILFYVYASRFEKGRAESFVKEMQSRFYSNVSDGVFTPKRNTKNLIVADVDPKGDVQGADSNFTEELKKKNMLSLASGYASWNTAGNTIGTALPQGIIFSLSKSRFSYKANDFRNPKRLQQLKNLQRKIAKAQTWFLLNRILDDYLFHGEIRPQINKQARDRKWNTFRLTPEQTKTIESEVLSKIQRKVVENLNQISPLLQNISGNIVCENVSNLSFILPWERTFEAEINFDLVCNDLMKLPKNKGKVFGVSSQ